VEEVVLALFTAPIMLDDKEAIKHGNVMERPESPNFVTRFIDRDELDSRARAFREPDLLRCTCVLIH
jgi:hypothetical protein